jgi:hypothetical protein
MTNNEGSLRQIKSSVAMAKAVFKKKNLSTGKLDLNIRKKLAKCYIWSLVCMVESRSEIPGKFRNVVLQKDGDQLDRSCEK